MKICKHTCVWFWYKRTEESSIACGSRCQILWEMALQYVR